MEKGILNILVCPKCQKSLNQSEKGLICKQCNQVYNIENGIIDFQVEPLEGVKALNSEYMNQEADYYDKIHLHMSKENDLFQGIINEVNTSGKIILDVATGTGFVLDNFKALDKEGKFLCLDISRNMLKRAIQKHRERIAVALKADAECMPITDGSLDMVTISSSLHHLPNPSKALEEIYRVLVPGGTLIIFHEPIANITHGLLFKALQLIYMRYNKLRPKTREDAERERRIREYAKRIFKTDEEEAFQKMQECNRKTNVQEGLNPFSLLNTEIYEIMKIQTYYPKKSMFNKLMGILFPNDGELFYIIARKGVNK